MKEEAITIQADTIIEFCDEPGVMAIDGVRMSQEDLVEGLRRPGERRSSVIFRCICHNLQVANRKE